MEAGAGADVSARRWRTTVTVFAWLLIAQSALSALFGLLSLGMATGFTPDTILSQLGPLGMGADVGTVDRFLRQLFLVNKVQIVANIVLLAGSVGLLRRRKWGWYTVVGVSLAEGVATFIWGVPAMQSVMALLDPERAAQTSMVMAVAVALIPAAVIVFLLLRDVTRQFEPPAA